MPRLTAADRKTREQLRAQIGYALNVADRPLERDALIDALPGDEIDADVFDEVLAEMVAANDVTDDDGEYTLSVYADDGDDDLDDDERVAVPELVRRDGYGYIVIEAPLDVVQAYANLHPAEQGTMSVSSAGALRHMLVEMGKLRVGRVIPTGDAPAVVVVAPEG